MAPRTTSQAVDGSTKTLREISWKELSDNNTADSCWIAYDGGVYDVTEWIERHPGGKRAVLLAGGRECTDLIRSYHPFSDKPEQVLKKYQIGTISTSEFPRFRKDTGFYKELSGRVKEYFDSNGIDYRSPWPETLRMLPLVPLLVLGYLFMFELQPAWLTQLGIHTGGTGTMFKIVVSAIFGAIAALPMMHIMHDASHFAFGWSDKWWATAGNVTMNMFAGADMLSWLHQHVVGHHLYTNVVGLDPDTPMEIEGDLRRVAPQQIWAAFYKYQHIYMPLLYGFLTMKFRIQDFTWTTLAGMNGRIRVNEVPGHSATFMVLTKFFHLGWRVLLPAFYWDRPLTEVLILYFISELAMGYYLAFNFQVSHVHEEAQWPVGKDGFFPLEWAKAQVETSLDYGHASPVTAFLTGALNLQTVHHLFPCVSQAHYPALVPIVRDVCRKHGVKYNEVGGFREALSLHIGHMANMGKQGKKPHMH